MLTLHLANCCEEWAAVRYKLSISTGIDDLWNLDRSRSIQGACGK